MHVAGLQTGGDHAFDGGRGQGGNILGAEAPPLFESEVARRERVGQDGALGFVERSVAEPHGAVSARTRAGAPCSTWVIWARIAIAISAGLLAPMASPMGP